jgi:hypothetical protein
MQVDNELCAQRRINCIYCFIFIYHGKVQRYVEGVAVDSGIRTQVLIEYYLFPFTLKIKAMKLKTCKK